MGISSPRLGIVCGLKSEEAALRRGMKRWPKISDIRADQCLIRCAGGRAELAARHAEELICHGVQGLMSAGFAGALSPALATADLLLPTAIVTDDPNTTYGVSQVWHDRVMQKLTGHSDSKTPLRFFTPLAKGRTTPLYGTNRALLTAQEKAACHRRLNADSVDMESHAVASVAKKHGVPFLAFRVVSDSAATSIPPAAMQSIKENGAINVAPILDDLILHPSHLAAYLALGRHAAKAKRALTDATAVCPGFFFFA